MKALKILILLFLSLFLCLRAKSTLMALGNSHSLGNIIHEMAEMGVNHHNAKKGGQFKLERFHLESVKTYAAMEKDLHYQIVSNKKAMAVHKKWFDIKLEESKFLLDDKNLGEQLRIDSGPENSTELSNVEQPAKNLFDLELYGPATVLFREEITPIFELPRRLEAHSRFSKVQVSQDTHVKLSGLSSISLAEPLPVQTTLQGTTLNFALVEEPAFYVDTLKRAGSITFRSEEKRKLKINERKRTATIQNPAKGSKAQQNPRFFFTEHILEHFADICKQLGTTDVKIKEISSAKLKMVALIHIPVEMRDVQSNLVSEYQVILVFDSANLYVHSVEPSASFAKQMPLVTFPHALNETVTDQVLGFIATTQAAKLGL